MPRHRSSYLFLLLYLLFIIYGSLFPLAAWRVPQHGLVDTWLVTAGRHVSRSDLLTNILVYIPLGFLISSICSVKLGDGVRILLATVLGTLLSFFMESIQLFLPARSSSLVDLLLNMLSTLLGALAYYWLRENAGFGKWLREWQQGYVCEGRTADIGLMLFAAWVGTQLAPFVPSLDVGDVKNGLKPLWLTLHDFSRFNCYRMATYALNIVSLGAALLLIMNHRCRVVFSLAVSCGMVLCFKIFVAGRQLSLEALAGLGFAVGLLLFLQRLPRGGLFLSGGISVALAYIADELRPDMSQAVAFHAFNWVPFSSQMGENVSGIGSILEGIWPFSMLGFFVISYFGHGRKMLVVTTGAALAVAVFALEYAQTSILGRYPDITSVILAITGWIIPWLMIGRHDCLHE